MTRGNIIRRFTLPAALALVGAMSAMPAFAQSTARECAAIAEDPARLACYDGLFRTAEGADAEAVVVSSESLIPARPTGREPATMTISCEPGGIRTSFAFGNQLVSATGDVAPLTFQVDQGGTAVRTLRSNDENTVLSFAEGRESATFLDGLAGGTTLRVRVTPVRQRSLTVDFRLAAVADRIETLRASCS